MSKIEAWASSLRDSFGSAVYPTWRVPLQLSERSKRSQSEFSVPAHQLFGTQPSLWSNSHICIWQLKKIIVWLYGLLSAKWCLYFLIHCLGILILHIKDKQLRHTAHRHLGFGPSKGDWVALQPGESESLMMKLRDCNLQQVTQTTLIYTEIWESLTWGIQCYLLSTHKDIFLHNKNISL